ncbi:lytic transglycosylase domain-containing protein [Pyrinomonas sp.]|uniref:lytic transglycosylase domain-containing protein n=1 Tax=Pyrinomonas sp. TaxID=2080306 RepID=UPI00331B4849
MRRPILVAIFIAISCAIALFAFERYWTHRFDAIIAKQAAIYGLDPDLVWSIIYEETYFRPWQIGDAGEVGLMQVTPTVGREWAAETGIREFEREMARDPVRFLRDPERNIQIGCWYLEKISKDYRDLPDPLPRVLAAYNAGPSRAAEWNRTSPGARPLTGEEFIARITYPTTRAYVVSIMDRYRRRKASAAEEGR